VFRNSNMELEKKKLKQITKWPNNDWLQSTCNWQLHATGVQWFGMIMIIVCQHEVNVVMQNACVLP